MKHTAIAHCRICGSDQLPTVFDLGDLASCGYFPPRAAQTPEATPLRLVGCEACGLVQLAHNYELEALFRQTYGYRSGLNAGMVSHLACIAAQARALVPLKPGDTVVDIGSNDGTLLGHYGRGGGLRRIGVDPTITQFASHYEPDIHRIADFFGPEVAAQIGPASARVVTSISMFYDLPDPNGFVAAVRQILAPDGVWILEQSYLPLMVDRVSFDTICHEHLEYYALEPLVRLMEAHGLRVDDVVLNDINGGSFRLVVRHAGQDASRPPVIEQMLAAERAAGYGGLAPFERLARDVEASRRACRVFFDKAASEGKRVHGYAASTKGNTLLQYFGLGPRDIEAIADVNPEKWTKVTPGTGIPIISEEESRQAAPDYYFVLAWHFRAGFIAREARFLERGGKLVFPLPRFEVVCA